MSTIDGDEVRSAVREHYGKVAELKEPGCAPGCCGAGPQASLKLGYSEEELASLPAGADLGLGCGNPQAIAALKPGDTVVDLGSGAGFDCFLAALKVGARGHVIGVDMTPAMISKARDNARKANVRGVEFRLGEIEHLPISDAAADVLLSNCVINLVPDKRAAFAEALRVLKPGGRLAISDVVTTAPLPPELQDKIAALTGCISGALPADELRAILLEVGFEEVRIDINLESRDFIRDWIPGSGSENYVSSATIEARKPANIACCDPGCCAS